MSKNAREQVDDLARLVGWTGSGYEGINWETVENSLGLPIPLDFKELIKRFPRGAFQGMLELSVPEDCGRGIELIGGLAIVLEDMRRWREDEPERFPYPLYPEEGGVVRGGRDLMVRSSSGFHVIETPIGGRLLYASSPNCCGNDSLCRHRSSSMLSL